MPDPSVSAELLAIYLEDARGQLEGLDHALLSLERDGFDPAVVATVLGPLHTLKGNSGMMGFSFIKEYVHRLEDVFARVSDGGLGLDTEVFDGLFAGASALRDALEQACRSGVQTAAGLLFLLFFLEDQPTDNEGDQAVKQRADQRGQKVGYGESFDDLRHKPEQKRVNHKGEESQRKDIDRQRKDDDQRTNNRVDQPQDQRRNERREKPVDLDAGIEIRDSDQGKGIQQPAQN